MHICDKTSCQVLTECFELFNVLRNAAGQGREQKISHDHEVHKGYSRSRARFDRALSLCRSLGKDAASAPRPVILDLVEPVQFA